MSSRIVLYHWMPKHHPWVPNWCEIVDSDPKGSRIEYLVFCKLGKDMLLSDICIVFRAPANLWSPIQSYIRYRNWRIADFWRLYVGKNTVKIISVCTTFKKGCKGFNVYTYIDSTDLLRVSSNWYHGSIALVSWILYIYYNDFYYFCNWRRPPCNTWGKYKCYSLVWEISNIMYKLKSIWNFSNFRNQCPRGAWNWRNLHRSPFWNDWSDLFRQHDNRNVK